MRELSFGQKLANGDAGGLEIPVSWDKRLSPGYCGRALQNLSLSEKPAVRRQPLSQIPNGVPLKGR